MKNLRYCNKCNEYKLSEICSICNVKTISKYPPRFSPQDNYGEYRRKLKKIKTGVN